MTRTPLGNLIVIPLLVVFPLAGLPIMWMKTAWRRDTKWAVTGIFFWPLWLRFLNRKPLPWAAKIALVFAATIGYALVLTPLSGAGVICGMTACVWAFGQRRSDDALPMSPRHVAAQPGEALLQRCDDLIAEIETDDIGLDLRGLRRQYVAALDTRARGAALLRSRDHGDVIAAGDVLNRAAQNLCRVQEALDQEPSDRMEH